MRSLALTAGFLFLFFSCAAQSDTTSQKNSSKYFNVFSSGAMLAKRGGGTSFSFQTIHGVRKGKIAVGLGTGLDTYSGWNIVPVVASISYDLVAIRNANLFVQASAGTVFGYPIDSENVYNYSFSKGMTWQPSLGYRIENGKWDIYFLAGYKIQTIQYTQTNQWWNWQATTTTVNRQIQRLTISLGVGLH